MVRRPTLGLLIVCCTAYACDGDDGDRYADRNQCFAETSTCDIEQTDCVRSVLELTACILGSDRPPLPEVEHLTASEVAVRLAEEIAEDAEDESRTDPWDAALRQLQLLPEGQSSTDAAVAQFVDSVAAYYDSETKGITIITDSSGESDALSRMYLLSHELTHYLQDRQHDLRDLQDAARASTDRALALTALVEGEAVVASTRALIAWMERSAASFRWDAYFDVLESNVIEGIADSSAPLYEALQSLPYTVGGRVVALAWDAGGRSAVDDLYDERPEAFCDWLDLSVGLGETLIEPLDCAPPLAPDGYTLFELDSLGAAGAFALLSAAGVYDLELAGALRNDVIALYVTEGTEDPASAPVLAVWRLRFADGAQAEEFEDAVISAIHAAVVIRKGVELSIRVSSDPSVMELVGASLAECPSLDELRPVRRQASGVRAAALRRGARFSP